MYHLMSVSGTVSHLDYTPCSSFSTECILLLEPPCGEKTTITPLLIDDAVSSSPASDPEPLTAESLGL
jgi:hypothetical protein